MDAHDTRGGTYSCAKCGNELFAASQRLSSPSGKLSFREPIDPYRMEYRQAKRSGAAEVRCKTCKNTLGAVDEKKTFSMDGSTLSFRAEEKGAGAASLLITNTEPPLGTALGTFAAGFIAGAVVGALALQLYTRTAPPAVLSPAASTSTPAAHATGTDVTSSPATSTIR